MSPLFFGLYSEVPFLKCFFQVKNKGLFFKKNSTNSNPGVSFARKK